MNNNPRRRGSKQRVRVKSERKRNYKGGLSDEVYYTDTLQGYIHDGYPAGYLGSLGRTAARDRIVEDVLAARGLNDDQIATWLTSTSGRHMMDSPPVGDYAFRQHVIRDTQSALEDVIIWCHPEHEGTLGSSMRLRRKLFPKKEDAGKQQYMQEYVLSIHDVGGVVFDLEYNAKNKEVVEIAHIDDGSRTTEVSITEFDPRIYGINGQRFLRWLEQHYPADYATWEQNAP